MTEARLSVYALKHALAARDYFEVVTMSFVDRDLEADFAGEVLGVALANPIASQMSVMRSTLIGSLVESVRFNVARKQERVRLFEVATCFRKGGTGFQQEERIAGVALGPAHPEQWGNKAQLVDYFDVRADVEAVLGALGATFSPARHPAFHPGQAAEVRVDDEVIGWVGALHPRWIQKYELQSAAVAFELRTAPILTRAVAAYRAVSRFPPVRRDLAFVVPDAQPAEALRAAIAAAGGPLVADVAIFDVYRGKGLPDGKKSLAFRVLLQDTEKTLTDAEVEALMRGICSVLEQNHNAVLRA
jgi:phenylalanyl-tRNA synthetase beta chain